MQVFLQTPGRGHTTYSEDLGSIPAQANGLVSFPPRSPVTCLLSNKGQKTKKIIQKINNKEPLQFWEICYSTGSFELFQTSDEVRGVSNTF